MIKYMSVMFASMMLTSGCFGIGGYKDFEPLTPMTVGQWEAVNHVESRVEAAIITFSRPAFKVRPQITVVSSPDQFISKFQKAWKDLPVALSVEERVEGEGFSGMWSPPDIYISTIGDRAAQFLSLYAHERAHTFFSRGSGHSEELIRIEGFLKGN